MMSHISQMMVQRLSQILRSKLRGMTWLVLSAPRGGVSAPAGHLPSRHSPNIRASAAAWLIARGNKQLKSETENFGILGNTVESAVQATKKVLYDLEHPVVYTPRSIDLQQASIKEGEFYRAFLEKLEQL